jgi:hypothetical protein
MKIWLNDLKEGDIFYHIILNKVYKCKHLGDANNMNFKMSRIKFEILDEDELFHDDLLGNIHEAFVNQYVYDNFDEAEERCIDRLKHELRGVKESIIQHKAAIVNLETREQLLKERISNYG